MLSVGVRLLEAGYLPDYVTRWGIRLMCAERLASLPQDVEKAQMREEEFVKELLSLPIAIQTKAANVQHYEVPTEFYNFCLGKRKKYSCCYYPTGGETLDEAEEAMFEHYLDKADLRDGQRVVDLGCGWGSLSLFLAQRFPNSQIVSISNSASQGQFIMSQGFDNVRHIKADIVTYEMEAGLLGSFDRVISLEMLEHMKNYELLFQKISTWLRSDGVFFAHIFVNRFSSYHYEADDPADEANWMTTHFFTGGTMPSYELLSRFPKHLRLQQKWAVNGSHYSKTCEHWLQNMDSNLAAIRPIFEECYGAAQTTKWIQRWRVFYMSCSELFNYDGGNTWFVGLYRFVKQQQ